MLSGRCIGGLFLAGRALSPIDQMATAAEQITGSDLSGRMGPQGSAELARLAASFDRMIARLDQAFQRERRFVSDVSHELRTPLTALRGRIEVTLTRPRSLPEYEYTLRTLETEVARLTRLSEDLLLLARLDRGTVVPRRERVDLGALLTAVCDQIRPLAADRGQVLEADVQADLVLTGDPDQLIRFFFNLLDNAVKYTDDDGRVEHRRQTRRRRRQDRRARHRRGHRPRASGQRLRPLLPRRRVAGTSDRRARAGSGDRRGDRPRPRWRGVGQQPSRPRLDLHRDASG